MKPIGNRISQTRTVVKLTSDAHYSSYVTVNENIS